MKAPRTSSNALSVLEAVGLVEGDGVSDDDTIKNDTFVCSSALMWHPDPLDSGNIRVHQTKLSRLALSRRPSRITATQRCAHGVDQRHGHNARLITRSGSEYAPAAARAR
jgi:hypothetical protein